MRTNRSELRQSRSSYELAVPKPHPADRFTRLDPVYELVKMITGSGVGLAPGMLRARRRDISIKPNRKLDKKSSRCMIYENEELRLRTIRINEEIEKGNLFGHIFDMDFDVNNEIPVFWIGFLFFFTRILKENCKFESFRLDWIHWLFFRYILKRFFKLTLSHPIVGL